MVLRGILTSLTVIYGLLRGSRGIYVLRVTF